MSKFLHHPLTFVREALTARYPGKVFIYQCDSCGETILIGHDDEETECPAVRRRIRVEELKLEQAERRLRGPKLAAAWRIKHRRM